MPATRGSNVRFNAGRHKGGRARQVCTMSPSETANLLRMAADGELTAEQLQALRAHLAANPEDRAFVEFERQLRAAIGRVMGEASAPPQVRARVESALHQAGAPLRLVGSRAEEPLVGGPARGRRRIFVPSGLAAGFLLLVGAAVVIGVLGKADWFDWGTLRPIPVGNNGGTLGFPIEEHRRCASDFEYAQRKFTIHGESDLRSHLADKLQWDVNAPDLATFGFALQDAGECSAGSGSVQAVHIRYSNGQTALSVWIEHSLPSELTHSADLQEDHAYLVTPTNRNSAPDEASAYYAWRVGDFVYRLVPASAPKAREMAVASGMPDVQPESFN